MSAKDELAKVILRRITQEGWCDDRADARAAATDILTSGPIKALVRELTSAIEIIEKHVPSDALGTNWAGDPSVPGGTYSWGNLDECLHYMRKALVPFANDTTTEVNV